MMLDWGWIAIGVLALGLAGVVWVLVAASARDQEAAERAYRHAQAQLDQWEAELSLRQRARSAQRGTDPWGEDDAG
jgi:hypothetical protein